MRHLLFLFVLLSFSVSCQAQDVKCYALTKQGASVQYSYTYGKKLMGYFVLSVQENSIENGKTNVKTLWTFLNKKGKPSKSASFAGYGEGMLSVITIENGSYYMTQDLGLAAGGENRHGNILKMPASLKVGDSIEGGKLFFENRFMGMTFKNELVYSDFKVVDEVDINTPAGNFHCLKVTGNVKGQYNRTDIDDDQTWYIAPGIGIVREEIHYWGVKKPVILEAYKVCGLELY